jgi:hypothetical protein
MRSFAPLVAVALASLAAGLATPAARGIAPYPGNEADPGYYLCSTTDCSGPQEGDDFTCGSIPFSSFPPGGNSPCLGTFGFRSAGIYAPSNVTSLDFDVRLISLHEFGLRTDTSIGLR